MRKLIVLAALLIASRAHADNANPNPTPVSTPTTGTQWPAWAQDGKAGRFMLNLKLGPAIAISRTAFSAASIELDFGIGLNADRSLYLVISPAVQAGLVGTFIIVPVGVQYDFKLPGPPGLYLSPRVLLGYAHLLPGSGASHATGYFEVALGLKYIFKQRWNISFEPFSLPVIFGNADGENFTEIYYRIMVGGGVNF